MIPMNKEQAPVTDRRTADAILTTREPRDQPRSASLLKKQWQQSLSVYRETLPPLLHLPAAWLLAAVWLAGSAAPRAAAPLPLVHEMEVRAVGERSSTRHRGLCALWF